MSKFNFWENHKAIINFREYLRIPSIHPNPNYDACVTFLRKQAAELGLTAQVYEPVKNNPFVIISWVGTDPSLQTILLSSHMDVVAVNEKSWEYSPFAAHMTAEGKIFARGAQDMKCVGIQYLEAVRKLINDGIKLKRSLHISFSPDEECGGVSGIIPFISTQQFMDLNIGFVLDEGMASSNNDYICYNSEKTPWQIHVHCAGNTGHSRCVTNNTAASKLRYILDKFMDYRDGQKSILEKNPNIDIGEVTTVNLTKIYGGVQSNVIPEKLTAVFDIRLANKEDHTEFEKMVMRWLKDAGEGVSHEYERKTEWSPATKLDETNKYWLAFKQAADEMNIKLRIATCTGATDSRYMRSLGIPVLGFTPINQTPITAHTNNEFINADTFLEGINIYVKLITAVANAL